MPRKFYVVWRGREPGIYTDWSSCNAQVHGFPAARFKSYRSLKEAEAAYVSGVPSKKKSAKKAPSSKRTSTVRRTSITTYTSEEVEALSVDTKIFSDGACEPNPGEAGSGLAIYRNNVIDELWYGLYNPQGTNNIAELNALHHGLLAAEDELRKKRTAALFSDSKYSIQCVTQWAISWEKKGWTKKGGEIKNLELIKSIYQLYMSMKDDIKILHVSGHSDIEGNELADRMSILAIDSQEVDMCRFRDELDVSTILNFRSG